MNGCGFPNIAEKVKNSFVGARWIKIIAWKNVESNKFIYNKSIIVVKKKNEHKLEYLMKITGIKRRIYAIDEDRLEEFQIILGKDYKRYFDVN